MARLPTRRRSRRAADPYRVMARTYDQAEHDEVTHSFFRATRPLAGIRGRSAVVVDFGCGTGVLAELLSATAHQVVGVDRSANMLAIARARCRDRTNVRFIEADLRSFVAPPPASAVLASADVVNHFPGERQLAAVFRGAFQCLRPGGTIAFDALNRFCFEQYWDDKTYLLQGPTGDLVMECEWNSDLARGVAAITSYTKRGAHHEKRQAVLEEYWHRASTIRRALYGAGFSSVRRKPWSPWSDQHLEPSLDRDLWTATRKR